MKFTREDMVKLLGTNKVNVTFTKVDGTERVMECTLNETYIPTEQRPKTENKYAESTIRVFDTVLLAWRSFRVDSVKDFKIVSY